MFMVIKDNYKGHFLSRGHQHQNVYCQPPFLYLKSNIVDMFLV